MRTLSLVAALVLAGIAAGAIWTWAQPDRYRADTRLLVRSVDKRVTPAVATLAESSLVAENVAQTLHLRSAPHVAARHSEGGILTVSVAAGGRERARQIDAEVVSVLQQKVAERFGPDTTTVLDPAHVAEQTSPTPSRNFLVAGLIGLALGVAAAALVRRRGETIAPVPSADEDLLQARVDEVTKRERALARHAGELAKRDARLAERERELNRKAADLKVRDLELKAREEAAEVVTEPEPSPPASSTAAVAVPGPAVRGRWNLNELERFVETHHYASAQQQEEWRTFLFLLREHADAEGMLPQSFDALVNDVFAGAW